MNYTKEDFKLLVSVLKGLKSYEVLEDFFESELKEDHLNFVNSVGYLNMERRLQELFPDAWHALMMPYDDIPLYLHHKTGQEFAISVWRLTIEK